VLVVVVVFVVVLPQYVTIGDLYFWETAAVAVLFATSTNLLFGQAGIPSFGQAAFFAVGAYTAALAAQNDWPVVPALLLGIALAAAAAGVAGVLAWRVTGLAFSMLTLAISQSLYTIAIKNDTLGGFNGISGFSITSIAGIDVTDPGYLWYATAVIVALGCLAFWVITRSSFGQTLRCIRENPSRALFLGVNVRAYRALAFTLAGAGAGLAGGVSAYTSQVVTPNAAYWTESATPVIMLVLGGIGYFLGPAVGAIILTALLHKLTDITHAYILYVGLLLYAVLLFLPQGLLSLPRVIRSLGSRRRVSKDPCAADEADVDVEAPPPESTLLEGTSR
jgi:branched-chain amino acid transport system permease protein